MNRTDLGKVHVAIPKLVDELESGKLDRREFLRTTTLLGLSAATAYAVAGKITGEEFVPQAHAQGASGGTIRVGMAVMDVSDPAVYDWSEKGNIARQIIEPLVKIGTDDIAHPRLAESWETNDDVSQWTFKLRQGIKWSNGDEFNADDVIATFERWLDPATGSSNQGRFIGLTVTEDGTTKQAPGSIERIDDYTVRFNLSSPMLAFPESCGDYPALITHRNFAADGANLIENPIGTGPFNLESFEIGAQASFSRKDDYWGGAVALDGVQFIDLGSDPAAHLAALSSGQVDLLYVLDVSLLPALQGMPNLKTYEKVTAITGVARMRITEPPYDNPQVRKAIQLCLDRERIMDLAYQGYGTVGQDFHVSPIHPGYVELPPLEQNVEEAKRLLAEAGHPDGIDLEINCVSDPKWESDIAVVMAQQLAPAGIRLNVNILPGGTYWDRWTTWPFSITQWTTRPLAVQVLSLAYRTGVAWNETGYSNPEFDALLDQAQATIDVEERKGLIKQLEEIMQADSIAVIPFWNKIFTASADKVQGFEYHFAREMTFHDVSMSA